MDTTKPFPILRLPYLAIEEIFKAMHPFEIINFSLISKRSKQVTKRMTFYPKYTVVLSIDKNLEIEIRGTNEKISYSYVMTSDEELGRVIKQWKKDDFFKLKIYKYSKNTIERFQILCKYVLEVFKRQNIDILSMYMDESVDHNVSIIDFLKTNEISVDGCYLFHTDSDINVDEHAAYLLKNIKTNDLMYFFLHINNENIDLKFPKGLKKLEMVKSQWIGYERLLEIDSAQVILGTNQFSNKDWNAFFKKWIAMEAHLNLEFLDFEFKSMEEFKEFALHDIPYEEVDKAVKRIMKTSNDGPIEINGGIDIRRIDGKTATFSVRHTSLWDDCLVFIH
ncbi:hypothetical protein CRE_16253 [Caenorhabditis remanei]|uniref:F-box domain-containing protein n=1 Tax=Caenorhabditis remanei TaxID=31234 RepID=E3N2J3_CAERE|nr:hypothetical protein CRE_16253 [Caenorhabditis remanei]